MSNPFDSEGTLFLLLVLPIREPKKKKGKRVLLRNLV